MLECSPCGKKFTGHENYEQHLQSEKHKKKMLSIPNEQTYSVDSKNCPVSNCNETIKCPVCDLSFDSLECFQSHTMTPQHALKVMLKSTTSNEITSSNDVINNHKLNATECKVESTDEESILPELNGNKSFGLSYENCQLCSKMFSGPEPYKQHLEGQAHRKKVALQNQTNVGVGLTLKCEICKKSFSGEVPYVQHMSSETHKKKLQSIEYEERYMSSIGSNSQARESRMEGKIDENKQWFCSFCNVQCSGFIPYNQHIGGSIHFKNVKRAQSQNKFVMPDSDMISMMQVSNLNESKFSEKSENMPQLVNGIYQKDNQERQNGFVFPEEIKRLKVVSNEELAKLVKVIPPDDKINFDELGSSENSVSEELRKCKESDENTFDDGA